jgi:DNA polymerase V
LFNRGVRTAYDLSQVADSWVQSQLTIRGLHTVKELRGEPCIDLESTSKPQKSLAVTRTFAGRVRAWHELEATVATFAARAAQKLRKFQQTTGAVGVFIAGDRHRDGDAYRRVSTTVPLVQTSNDSSVIIAAALAGLGKIYDSEFSYRRAGIVCVDLASEETQQLSWLADASPAETTRRNHLMHTVDALNDKYHAPVVRHAVERTSDIRDGSRRSRAYTTSWGQLPTVH